MINIFIAATTIWLTIQCFMTLGWVRGVNAALAIVGWYLVFSAVV